MLEGKTALVTGSGRGIGRVMVESFVQNGADVIAHARRDTAEFRDWCATLTARYGVSVIPVFFDLTDSVTMKAAVRALITAKVPVNVLVNNAGMAHGGLFQKWPLFEIKPRRIGMRRNETQALSKRLPATACGKQRFSAAHKKNSICVCVFGIPSLAQGLSCPGNRFPFSLAS